MVGGLIQMNAHMVRTADSRALMIIGIIVLFLFACLAVCAGLSHGEGHKMRWVVVFLAIAVAGTAMLITGFKQPKVKIIRACVNGPVSLEQVSTVYDIVDVDGKMLTLRVR